MGKSRQKGKLSVFQQLLLYLNWLAILSLGLAYLATFVNPKYVAFPQFFGLIYPILLIINSLFVILWLYLRKKYFLYSALAIVLGAGLIGRTFNFSKPKRIYTKSFSIMTYNVRLFNVYKWSGDFYTVEKIANIVSSKKPDILCMQEFLDNKKLSSTAKFSSLYANYIISTQKPTYSYGQAIFTNYPVVNSGKLINQQHIFALYADIKINNRIVRVINVHLRSVSLAYDEYNTIDSLKFNNKRLNKIFRKLTSGYRSRQYEVKKLAQLIDTTEYPIILCGDFNDTPVSFTYTKISKRLKDAFTVAGLGIGNTYTYYLPILRIDFIFYSSGLHLVDFSRIKVKLSDHYPLFAEFGQ